MNIKTDFKKVPLNYQMIANELSLIVAGHKFPRLSQVGAGWTIETNGPRISRLWQPQEQYFIKQTKTERNSFYLLDFLLGDSDKKFRLIEANGSNAALSSACSGVDTMRSQHIYRTVTERGIGDGNGVLLFAFQKNFLHIAEFHLRVAAVCDLLSADGYNVRFANASENIEPNDEIDCIADNIENICNHIDARNGKLYYRGKVVIFATNGNILPEFIRHDKLYLNDGEYYCKLDNTKLDLSFFHEGKGVLLTHDRQKQQDIVKQLNNPNFLPIDYVSFFSYDDLMRNFKTRIKKDTKYIIKMNAGSGGAGMAIVDGNSNIKDIYQDMLKKLKEKYGADVEKSIFPFVAFEFVESTRYSMKDGGHRWDLRVECLVSHKSVTIKPCVLRICQAPVDNCDMYRWESTIANLTGRIDPQNSLRYMRYPFNKRKSDDSITVLDSIQINDALLDALINFCASYCEVAEQEYYSD